MIGLLQRVTRASVRVDESVVGEIGSGLLVLLCAERGDTARQAAQLMAKIMALRIFADDNGKMNRSVRDVDGGVLLVPQFTLAADTRSGTRPSFTPAAPPQEGRALFERCVALARETHAHVATGEFGAMMQVELVNDGPVTIWLRIEPEIASPASKEALQ